MTTPDDSDARAERLWRAWHAPAAVLSHLEDETPREQDRWRRVAREAEAMASERVGAIVPKPGDADLDGFEGRAARIAYLVDMRDAPGVLLHADDGYAIHDVLVEDVPALVARCRRAEARADAMQARCAQEADAEVASAQANGSADGARFAGYVAKHIRALGVEP